MMFCGAVVVLVTVVVQRLSFWAVVRPRPLEEPTLENNNNISTLVLIRVSILSLHLVEAVHEDAE